MADTVIAIAPAPVITQGAPVLVRTDSVMDTQGRTTAIQVITVADSDGQHVDVLTEETGQSIVQLLTEIKSILVRASGSGFE